MYVAFFLFLLFLTLNIAVSLTENGAEALGGFWLSILPSLILVYTVL